MRGILVAAVATLLVATASPAWSASVVLNPTTGPVGTSVAVAGTGFDDDRTCTIHVTAGPIPIDDTTLVATCAVTGGDLTGSFTIAPDHQGQIAVWACTAPGGAPCSAASATAASSPFTVTAPTTTTSSTSTTTTSTSTTTTSTSTTTTSSTTTSTTTTTRPTSTTNTTAVTTTSTTATTTTVATTGSTRPGSTTSTVAGSTTGATTSSTVAGGAGIPTGGPRSTAVDPSEASTDPDDEVDDSATVGAGTAGGTSAPGEDDRTRVAGVTVSPESTEQPLAAEGFEDEPWWSSILVWVAVFLAIGLLGTAADYLNRRRQRTGWAQRPG